MAPPTTYSESQFQDYILTALGDDVSSILGWDIGSPAVVEAVNDTLLDMGVSDIGTVSDVRGLRALGRRAIWAAAVRAFSGSYNIVNNGQTLSREQLQKQALESLKLATVDCLAFDPDYAATLRRVDRAQDPYVVLPPQDRPL